MGQAVLIPGFYRCDNCGSDVARTRRTRRFRMCDTCWAEIMPDWEQSSVKGRDPAWYAETNEQHNKIAAYWSWLGKMEKRYPLPYRKRTRSELYFSYLQPEQWKADDLYPLCDCGRPRKRLATVGEPVGLWGGPFGSQCIYCEARSSVDAVVRLHQSIHPEWDDEDWLDMLFRVFPKFFELGVLPDYWFELKGKL